MTREELRDYVDEQRTLNNIPYHVYSALIDGIDTLEQESCEVEAIKQSYNKGFEDCRQAVLDKKELIELEDGQSFYCISPEDVKTLSPATPQPKTGHWINETSGYAYNGRCSCCRCLVHIKGYNYCPRCGVKMKEVEI